jgi:general L-amino acid transport system permease protein
MEFAMATISQSKADIRPQLELDVAGYLRETVFSSPWKILFAIVLLGVNLLLVRGGFAAKPVGLSFNLAPNGVPTVLGNLILTLTDGGLLTALAVGLWLIGGIYVIYGAVRHHWAGPGQWLKESIYTGPFGALVSLALGIIIIFAIRGVLSWAVFGAEFRANPDSVAILRPDTPGAIWGIVAANKKLFAFGRYPDAQLWRIWSALAVVLALGGLSFFAWGFGSPLKALRRAIVWGWLASIVVIYFLLKGLGSSGPLPNMPTNLWGGFMLTVVLAVTGIVASFPIGVVMALGRRSEVRGVPYLWAWGAGLLLLYWGLFGRPSESVTLNIPVLFLDPPIWSPTLSPFSYALLQAILVIGAFWIVGHYFGGNMIKTFSILYIELIRGVPLITVLFMANVMLPIFLPKQLEIDNLLRVVVGIILFSAAYMAENVRGGLQAIPKGQYEAAAALGLSTAQSTRLIILPQALRAVIPAIVGLFIGLFKDTSLVAIVGLFDLLRIGQVVVAQDDWLGLQRETYAFVALVYWIFAFSMSRASQRLEKNLGVGKY